jgi:hypothetical protein
MPETFGEADVILRIRLDEATKDLERAEAVVLASQSRVQAAQDEAMRSVAEARQENNSLLGDLALAGAVAFNKWWLLTKAIGGVKIALMSIPAVAAAASAAAVAGAIGIVAVAGLIAGKIVEIGDRAEAAVREIARTTKALDGSRQSAEEMIDAYEQLPIIGGLAAQVMAQFSGNAEAADRKLMSLVGTIEDGEVKLKGWASLLGRLTGDTQAIEAINDRLREMNSLLDLRNRLAAAGGGRAEALQGITEADSDAAATAGLEGVDLVRKQNEIAFRERMQQFDALKMELNRQTTAELNALQARQDAEEISAKQYRIQRAAIIQNLRAGEESIAEARRESERDLARAGDQRIADAKELVRLEKERADAATQAETQRTAAMARAEEMRAAGDDFGAEAVEIEQRRIEAVRQAREAGNEQAVRDLNRYYDALLVQLGQRQQQELDQTRQAEQKRLMTLREAADRAADIRRREAEQARDIANRRADDLLSIESQIVQEKLRQAGRDAEAEQERIEDSFGRRIRQAIDNGDQELADLLRRLRDVELEGIANRDESQRAGSIAQTRDISLSRSAVGGGVAGETPAAREQRKGNKTLERIERNTREPRTARAG